MPIARFEMPDGRIGRFEVPEGTTPEQAQKMISDSLSLQGEQKQPAARVSNKIDYGKTAEEQPFQDQILQGIGGSMVGMGLGARQLAGYAFPSVKPSEQEVSEYQAAMEGLRGTAGGFIGEAGTYVVPGLGAMKTATTVPRIAGMLAQGGLKGGATVAGIGAGEGMLQGALTPVTEEQSRLENIAAGGAIGAIAPAATGAVLSGARTIGRPFYEAVSGKAIKQRAGKVMADAAGRKSATEVGEDYKNVLDELTKQKDLISTQTAGQAATEANVPTFSALQKIADAYKSIPAAKLETAQEQARLKALRTIGRDEPHPDAPKLTLTAAEKARDKAASNFYGKAFAADDMRLEQLSTQASRRQGGIGQSPTGAIQVDSRIAPLQGNEILSDAAQTIMRETNQYGNPFTNLRGLDYMKKVIDADIAAIRSSRPTALKNVNESQLYSAKAQLLSAMEDLSPAYAQARTRYAELSVPINKMKVGQVLEDALAGTIGGAERKTVFANKIKAAQQIIKKSTGQDRYDSLSKLFDERQMGIVKNILKELEINEKLASQAQKGMTEQARKLGIEMEPAKIPHMMSNAITIGNSLIDKITGNVKQRTLAQIADFMQDPKVAAAAMNSATERERNAIKTIIAAQKTMAVAAPVIYKEEQQ